MEAYVEGRGPVIKQYGSQGASYAESLDVRRRQYELRITRLRRALPHGARLLEVGASSGLFLALAREAGFAVTGLEPSNEARKMARSLHGLTLLATTIDEAEFGPDSFDAVVSSHVFEHLLDPLGAASKAGSWLSPGGLHVIEVPNQWVTLGAHLRRAGVIRTRPRQPSFTSIHHPVFFSRRTLRILALKSGLRPVEIRDVWYEPGSMASIPKRLASAAVGGASVLELTARKEALTSA
jgi:SAM-dependent methyltransferase